MEIVAGWQVERLLELFQRRGNEEVDYAMCRRFLIARKGDDEAARDMLEKCLEWRARVRPAEITAADVQNEFASRKAYAQGVDRSNRGIIWAFAGRHNKNKRDLQEMCRFIPFCMERGLEISEEYGTEQICLCYDLTGFGFKSMDYDLVQHLINILANYYPERLGRVLLWNAPTLFVVFWRVIKPWIDPVTVQKILFVDSTHGLKDFVDPAMYPKEVAQRVR